MAYIVQRTPITGTPSWEQVPGTLSRGTRPAAQLLLAHHLESTDGVEGYAYRVAALPPSERSVHLTLSAEDHAWVVRQGVGVQPVIRALIQRERAAEAAVLARVGGAQ
jgi:hypothetical protein